MLDGYVFLWIIAGAAYFRDGDLQRVQRNFNSLFSALF